MKDYGLPKFKDIIKILKAKGITIQDVDNTLITWCISECGKEKVLCVQIDGFIEVR